MLLDIVTKGATDRSVVLRIIDSTDGTPETGVVFNTSGIDLWYRREGAAKTPITEATLAALTTAHTDGGFLHIGDGYYRLDLPDAAFATGANSVDVGGAVTGMVVIGGRVRLVNADFEQAISTEADIADAVRVELSAELTKVNDYLDGSVLSRASQASVDAVDDFLDTEITAIKAKTDNLPADPADASDVLAATTAIAGYVDTEVAAVKAVTDKLDTALELDGSVYRYTTNALENAPAGGGGGTSDWSSGEREQIRHRLGIDGTASAPSATPSLSSQASLTSAHTKLDTIDDFLDTEVAAIKAKTDALPSDPADASDVLAATTTIAGYLDTEIAAIKAKTDLIPSDPADQSAIEAAIDAAEAAILAAIPSAAANAAAFLDASNGVETSITPRQALRLILAASAGKLSGAATTTVTIRNVGDSKDRITATVDADGNRTAVTTDAT